MKLYGRSLVCFGLLGLVGVGGAVDCAPSSKSYTIKTAQDATDIITCSTFTGSILVAADGPESVSLDGITSISGNIDVENVAQLHSLSSTTLATVASLTLNNLSKLSNLSFPALTNFSSLKLSNLPSLTECMVATGSIQGEIQDVAVYNTSLKSLDWLKWPIGTGMNISNNANLEKFDITYSTINSGSALAFSNNPNLTTVDVSGLTGIYGGLDISGNNELVQVAFGKLETIGGFVQMHGAFTNVSMPALSSITGALTVGSTGDITRLCDNLEKQKLAGHYTCTPNVDKASDPTATSGGSATSTATSTSQSNGDPSRKNSHGSGLDSGEIAGAVVACIISAILALVAAFFYFRRRLRAKVQEITQNKDAGTTDSDSSLELGDRHTEFSKNIELDSTQRGESSLPKELESPSVALEMTADNARLELPGGMLAHELEGRDTRNGSLSTIEMCSPHVRHELPG